jgi:hypothetical protein
MIVQKITNGGYFYYNKEIKPRIVPSNMHIFHNNELILSEGLIYIYEYVKVRLVPYNNFDMFDQIVVTISFIFCHIEKIERKRVCLRMQLT